MSKLNFSQISEAFILGSDQIKNTQDEIATLKKLITDSSIEQPGSKSKQKSGERIGPPDTTVAKFNHTQQPQSIDLLQIVNHPRFDDIAKNYIFNKYPQLLNRTVQSTEYVPQRQFGKQSFGNQYATTISTNLTHYLIFLSLIHISEPTRPY